MYGWLCGSRTGAVVQQLWRWSGCDGGDGFTGACFVHCSFSDFYSISFSMFIIISDTRRCLVVLNDSPLLYYNNTKNKNNYHNTKEYYHQQKYDD